jgi:transcriptional regulator with XRE-family HTH domain
MASMRTVRLRVAREGRGFDMATLARLSGVGQYTISRLESGATVNPTVTTARRLERALGLKPGQLVFGDSEALSA